MSRIGCKMDYISDSEIQSIVRNVLDRVTEKQINDRPANCGRIVAIGGDHGGFNMKQQLIPFLEEMGCRVLDCGPSNAESVDYPDFAFAVAEKISTGEACRGIMIDGAGIGSCMVANKVPGIRAAMCYDYATALNCREHNNANYLTLGAGLIGLNQAKLIVRTFLTTDFGGGRHERRVDKIMQVESRFLKEG